MVSIRAGGGQSWRIRCDSLAHPPGGGSEWRWRWWEWWWQSWSCSGMSIRTWNLSLTRPTRVPSSARRLPRRSHSPAIFQLQDPPALSIRAAAAATWNKMVPAQTRRAVVSAACRQLSPCRKPTVSIHGCTIVHLPSADSFIQHSIGLSDLQPGGVAARSSVPYDTAAFQCPILFIRRRPSYTPSSVLPSEGDSPSLI